MLGRNSSDGQRTFRAKALTRLEMLMVIAVIGILAALLLPGLSKSKQQAQGSFCLNKAVTQRVGEIA